MEIPVWETLSNRTIGFILLVLAVWVWFRKIGKEDDKKEIPEEDGEKWTCKICKNELSKDIGGNTCEECEEENICDDCALYFENAAIHICKKCIDKVYKVYFPKEEETKKQEEVEEPEEVKPIHSDESVFEKDI